MKIYAQESIAQDAICAAWLRDAETMLVILFSYKSGYTPIGIAARDIRQGEVLQYDPADNTEDILTQPIGVSNRFYGPIVSDSGSPRRPVYPPPSL